MKHGMLRYIVAALTFWGLAAVPFLAEALGQSYLVNFATRIMIFALAAVTLDFILGVGGLVSLGHAIFIGIGAYTVALFALYQVTELLVILPIAIAAGALFALLTGSLALRTRGINFIMITLAFAQMLYFGTTSFSALGGDDGFSLPMRSSRFGPPSAGQFARPLLDKFRLPGALLFAISDACAFFLWPRTRALKQNSENGDSRHRPMELQLRAYVISGAVCAIAGVLLANLSGFISPSSIAWQRSGDLIIMSVVGGQGTIIGAILGAIGFLGLEEYLSHYMEYWRLVLGPIAIIIALLLNKPRWSWRRNG